MLVRRWFQDIILANRACGGGISAWKGTNQTDAPGNRYGAYIWDARVIRVWVIFCLLVVLIACEVPRCQFHDGYHQVVLPGPALE